jgi:hypothetical protein
MNPWHFIADLIGALCLFAFGYALLWVLPLIHQMTLGG